MIDDLLKFLLGTRIHKAIIEEWRTGDKMTAFFVMFCVTSTPVLGLLKIVEHLVKH